MNKHIQIALDGPSGAGKSTAAKALAAKLGIIYVDTGALYRTVGYYVRSKNVDPKDAEGVTALLGEIALELRYENGAQQVYLNGERVGDAIRHGNAEFYVRKIRRGQAWEFNLKRMKD